MGPAQTRERLEAERAFRSFMRKWGLVNLVAVMGFSALMLLFFDAYSSAITGAFLGFLSASLAFPVREAMELYLRKRLTEREREGR